MTNDKNEHPAALLTKKDREWLRADEPMYTGDSAKQQRYRRRRSIKERTLASIDDLALLSKRLDPHEREKIAAQLEMRGESRVMGGPIPPSASVTDAIAFLYLLHDSDEQFEMAVRRALRATAEHRHQTESAEGALFHDIEVDINFTEWSHGDIQTLKEKINDSGIQALNSKEQRFVLERVGDDVLSDALGAQINPPDSQSHATEWP